MQNRFNLSVNGQELQQVDVNEIAQEASMADDVVFAEMLRMAPYVGTVSRAILPYGFRANDAGLGTVTNGGNAVTGGVCVNPFRAIVGARTSSVPLKFTDIRSAMYVNSTGTVTERTVTLAAQTGGAGTTRVDLIYATLYVDQNDLQVTRNVMSGGVKTPTSLSVNLKTYVAVNVQAGTASASPTLPTIPGDPPGGYNIPLAYVSLPNGFSSSSVVPSANIMDISPCVSLNYWQDGPRPVSAAYTAGSALFTGVAKSSFYMPPSMMGRMDREAMFDGTIASGTVLDTGNWLRRRVKCFVQVASGAGQFQHLVSGGVPNSTATTYQFMTMTVSWSSADPILFTLTNANTGGIVAAGATISLKVDRNTGNLYLATTGTPGASCYVSLESTAPFVNLV